MLEVYSRFNKEGVLESVEVKSRYCFINGSLIVENLNENKAKNN